MESMLKLLVALTVIAGLIWVASPILSSVVSGGFEKPPDLKVARLFFDVTPNPECDCAPTTCEVSVSGSLSNQGGPAKNILMTVFFFDEDKKNLGSQNMPLIGAMGGEQSMAFAYNVNASCETANVTISVMHLQKI